ncbi:hypothetical protein COO91_03376 [Nostoc flagelliforme CCNUN1]|uniref:Uncharacterized protein n=1 Tax=Nostoc flagelliforme CCNUN1 TaxID=2038116 RepID=A0A2K8SPS8_9NOSO|nr:hypothetical protein COO91_03376 [Nostoc flagelliforme CCNUN1]
MFLELSRHNQNILDLPLGLTATTKHPALAAKVFRNNY